MVADMCLPSRSGTLAVPECCWSHTPPLEKLSTIFSYPAETDRHTDRHTTEKITVLAGTITADTETY